MDVGEARGQAEAEQDDVADVGRSHSDSASR